MENRFLKPSGSHTFNTKIKIIWMFKGTWKQKFRPLILAMTKSH